MSCERGTTIESAVTQSHLRFAPDTLIHLGERLVPHIEQGIAELVKNAYDADATECRIALDNRVGGELRVSDDGVGMTYQEIEDGWLVLGRSTKQKRSTPVFGRTPVGDKGLGRLAGLRLELRATI